MLFLFSVVFSAPVPTLLPNPNNSKPELVNVYSRIVDITVLSMGDPQNLSTLRTFPMDDCSDLESVYFTLTSKNSNETPSLNLPNVVWRGFNPMQKKLALQAEVTILGPDRIRPLMTDAFLKVNILTVLPLAKAKLQRISEIEEEDAAPNLTDKAGSSSSNGERRDKYLEAAWLSSCPFRRTLIRKAAARLPMSIICERPTSTFKMVLILRILGAVGDMTIWRPSFGRLFEYTGIKVGAWDAAFTDQTAIKCEVPEKSSAINDESHSRQMSWTKNVILQTIDNQVGPSALQILPHDETFELKGECFGPFRPSTTKVSLTILYQCRVASFEPQRKENTPEGGNHYRGFRKCSTLTDGCSINVHG